MHCSSDCGFPPHNGKGAQTMQTNIPVVLDTTGAEAGPSVRFHQNRDGDMPDRNVVEDLKAAQSILTNGITGLDIVKALYRKGFEDVAQSVLNMLKQRVAGDYLHTSAIIDRNGYVISAVNDVNDYHGPSTGYQISKERWEEIKNIPNAISPDSI